MIGFYNYTVIATYLATLLGVCGIFFAMDGRILGAIFCLLLSGLLDSVDGKIARTKKDRTENEKRFGIQIDSLNDLICFGALPAVLGYAMCREVVERVDLNAKAFFVFRAVFLVRAIFPSTLSSRPDSSRQKMAPKVRPSMAKKMPQTPSSVAR